MLSTTDTWVDAIKKHALKHYTEDGWDILVECWDDAYIAEHYRGCKSLEEAIVAISKVLSAMDGWRSEITSEGF